MSVKQELINAISLDIAQTQMVAMNATVQLVMLRVDYLIVQITKCSYYCYGVTYLFFSLFLIVVFYTTFTLQVSSIVV